MTDAERATRDADLAALYSDPTLESFVEVDRISKAVHLCREARDERDALRVDGEQRPRAGDAEPLPEWWSDAERECWRRGYAAGLAGQGAISLNPHEARILLNYLRPNDPEGSKVRDQFWQDFHGWRRDTDALADRVRSVLANATEPAALGQKEPGA